MTRMTTTHPLKSSQSVQRRSVGRLHERKLPAFDVAQPSSPAQPSSHKDLSRERRQYINGRIMDQRPATVRYGCA